MCCRLRVANATREMLPLLTLAGFTHLGDSIYWTRDIADEQTTVRAAGETNGIVLSLYPTVATYAQHAHKRRAAGLMFQVAALLAEKCGGIVTQESNVSGCLTPERPSTAIVADYPARPLLFENLCAGWAEVLLAPERDDRHLVPSK